MAIENGSMSAKIEYVRNGDSTAEFEATVSEQGMAVEMAPKVRVNCVCPVSAATNSDFQSIGQKDLPEEMEQRVIDGIPMGRRATPEDVADAYAFLASEEAKFLTGVSLDIDGGRSIQ